jgi:hypothetical protein
MISMISMIGIAYACDKHRVKWVEVNGVATPMVVAVTVVVADSAVVGARVVTTGMSTGVGKGSSSSGGGGSSSGRRPIR